MLVGNSEGSGMLHVAFTRPSVGCSSSAPLRANLHAFMDDGENGNGMGGAGNGGSGDNGESGNEGGTDSTMNTT